MRFRTEQHLRRPGEIRAIREHGQRIDCGAFTVWWNRRAPVADTGVQGVDHARVCVIASTASVGIAVRRNRAKRRLREIFRGQQSQVPADCDLLLVARAPVLNRPMTELEHRFANACQRMKSTGVTNV